MAMVTTKAIALAMRNRACTADLNTNTLRITLLHLLVTLPLLVVMATVGLDLLNQATRTNHTLDRMLMAAASKIHSLVQLLDLVSLSTELIVVQRILLSRLDPAHLCKAVDLVLLRKVRVHNSKAACNIHKTNRRLVDILDTAGLEIKTLSILDMADMAVTMHLPDMAQLMVDEAGQVSMAVVNTRRVDALPGLSCKQYLLMLPRRVQRMVRRRIKNCFHYFWAV